MYICTAVLCAARLRVSAILGRLQAGGERGSGKVRDRQRICVEFFCETHIDRLIDKLFITFKQTRTALNYKNKLISKKTKTKLLEMTKMQ